MKKLLCLLLVTIVVLGLFAGCAKEKFEIALITDIGTIDDKSFNQGAWEGVVAYAEANDVSHKYYKPSEASDEAYVGAIDLAVKGGAKVIVTPGFAFGNAIGEAQTKYPDVSFILLDTAPTGEHKDNVYAAIYKEQEVGFLAGYAAVKDGYTKLGFAGGMPFPAVVRYGYGFIAGAEYAAQEMGVEDVEVKYTYLGGFLADPAYQTLAASWYQDGTEIIFAAAGGAGNSVFAAAEQEGAKAIGVDVDQSGESETVIVSAMKGLGSSVEAALADYYADEFKGGKLENLGAESNGVSLSMESSRFNKFSQGDYDAIFAALAEDKDGVSSNIPTDATVESAAEIETSAVTVEVIGE